MPVLLHLVVPLPTVKQETFEKLDYLAFGHHLSRSFHKDN